MASVDLILWSISLLFAGSYVLSFRWARRTLGERDVAQIPAARAFGRGGHRGFGEEPGWVRTVQSAILAFGLTGIAFSVVGFVGLACLALLA